MLDWLSSSLLARIINETIWGFPINEIVHILSASVLVGVSLVWWLNSLTLQRRFAGPLRALSVPLTLVSAALAILSGVAFFAAWPERYIGGTLFITKLILLATLGIFFLVYLCWSPRLTLRHNQILSSITAVTAIATIVAGRLMGHFPA